MLLKNKLNHTICKWFWIDAIFRILQHEHFQQKTAYNLNCQYIIEMHIHSSFNMDPVVCRTWIVDVVFVQAIPCTLATTGQKRVEKSVVTLT